MHAHVEIWLPAAPRALAETVAEAMAPFQERWSDEHDTYLGYWDWYQIGGRWKGVHYPGYDAERDPEHVETCKLCGGTGERPGFGRCNGGCSGTGKRVAWPTQWKPHPLDIIAVQDAPPDLTAKYLLAEANWHELPEDGLVIPALVALGLTGGFLVTVDIHS